MRKQYGERGREKRRGKVKFIWLQQLCSQVLLFPPAPMLMRVGDYQLCLLSPLPTRIWRTCVCRPRGNKSTGRSLSWHTLRPDAHKTRGIFQLLTAAPTNRVRQAKLHWWPHKTGVNPSVPPLSINPLGGRHEHALTICMHRDERLAIFKFREKWLKLYTAS